MYVEGTLRWQVTEDCPWDLLMALRLRDIAGLGDVGDPVLPPMSPGVGVSESTCDTGSTVRAATLTTSTDADAANAQRWHGRGGDRVQARGEAEHQADRAQDDLRRQWLSWWARAAKRETRPFVTPLVPPHFAAFDRQLELQDLIETHYDQAAQWAGRMRDDYLERSAARRVQLAADIVEPVHLRERALRRQTGFFHVDICVLPFEQRGIWIIAPHTVAISRDLREDSAAFRVWWSEMVDALV